MMFELNPKRDQGEGGWVLGEKAAMLGEGRGWRNGQDYILPGLAGSPTPPREVLLPA